jgi:hypothetical protein
MGMSAAGGTDWKIRSIDGRELMDMTVYWRVRLTERTRRSLVRARCGVTAPGLGRSGVEKPGGVVSWAEKTLWTGPREPSPTVDATVTW